MWRLLMEMWYRMFGQSRDDYSCGCSTDDFDEKEIKDGRPVWDRKEDGTK